MEIEKGRKKQHQLDDLLIAISRGKVAVKLLAKAKELTL